VASSFWICFAWSLCVRLPYVGSKLDVVMNQICNLAVGQAASTAKVSSSAQLQALVTYLAGTCCCHNSADGQMII